MKKKNIIFGTSLTFTNNNIHSLISREFIDKLHDFGCKVVFFIEYVPINGETKGIAPSDAERELLLDNIECLRKEYKDMLFMSFPGDEKESGGCLAAGRGFFHINSHGGAEPCPASPYSDINVKDTSLLEALNSKLFKSLREGDILMDEHEGGCVLFEHREEVEKLLSDKVYEQSIGFLRITEGDNILDSTGIHPESYGIAINLLKELNMDTL